MCDHEHSHKEQRRGFLKMLGSALGGLVGFFVGVKAAEAGETCGAKCISLPYDGGTCTKPKNPFHQWHRCSKGHTW
jgi:hypothetical protein